MADGVEFGAVGRKWEDNAGGDRIAHFLFFCFHLKVPRNTKKITLKSSKNQKPDSVLIITFD